MFKTITFKNINRTIKIWEKIDKVLLLKYFTKCTLVILKEEQQ